LKSFVCIFIAIDQQTEFTPWVAIQEGTLTLIVIGARDLLAMDTSNKKLTLGKSSGAAEPAGTSDPFCQLYLNQRGQPSKSNKVCIRK
jgi:hypothetical protein